MKVKTALILCAGFGKRVQPITDSLPKPLINYKDETLLENTIKFLIKLKINKIKINVFYLKEKRLKTNSIRHRGVVLLWGILFTSWFFLYHKVILLGTIVKLLDNYLMYR